MPPEEELQILGPRSRPEWVLHCEQLCYNSSTTDPWSASKWETKPVSHPQPFFKQWKAWWRGIDSWLKILSRVGNVHSLINKFWKQLYKIIALLSNRGKLYTAQKTNELEKLLCNWIPTLLTQMVIYITITQEVFANRWKVWRHKKRTNDRFVWTSHLKTYFD